MYFQASNTEIKDKGFLALNKSSEKRLLPIQNLLKILPNNSLVVTSPVIGLVNIDGDKVDGDFIV